MSWYAVIRALVRRGNRVVKLGERTTSHDLSLSIIKVCMPDFKSLAVFFACCACMACAWALTPLPDHELRQVVGQDGATTAVNADIKIGQVTWTDTDIGGGGVSINNIAIKGLFVSTVDVLSRESFANSSIYSALGPGVYDGVSDVVQLAFPNTGMDAKASSTVTVGSITNGMSNNSYGSFSLVHFDVQGTKMWVWSH